MGTNSLLFSIQEGEFSTLHVILDIPLLNPRASSDLWVAGDVPGAKDLGKKYASGSSVTKVPGGGEEITVQGDNAYDIEEFLMDTYKDIPEDSFELIEDKKKKSAQAAG